MEIEDRDISLTALVAECRSDATTDIEFAKRVAVVCASLADRAAVDWGQGASMVIRRVFKLE